MYIVYITYDIKINHRHILIYLYTYITTKEIQNKGIVYKKIKAVKRSVELDFCAFEIRFAIVIKIKCSFCKKEIFYFLLRFCVCFNKYIMDDCEMRCECLFVDFIFSFAVVLQIFASLNWVGNYCVSKNVIFLCLWCILR